ncbi:MAG: hypothetical protein GYB66_04710 [Chloroflexi bacterium]|nr:hypothetical protein [Chloroflexota bacterium]
MRRILLFDVDGVLVHPTGYKAALRDTVDYFAAQMGLPAVNLSLEEIAVFEACGLTNEWDSAALCVGALLSAGVNSGIVANTFTDALAAIRDARIRLPRPDFSALATQVSNRSKDHQAPTAASHALLQSQTAENGHSILAVLFNDIYDIQTPTTRIQQVHTLGSTAFEETYAEPAPFACESYLVTHDTALLRSDHRDHLLAWARKTSTHGFTVFTARPSRPPDGAISDMTGYAPEAELAIELLGLPRDTALIAGGRMEWLARQNQRTAADYIKPSPVQALAAIGAAVADDEIAALQAAAALYERNQLIGPLASLASMPTQVVVFEDSTGGIQAVRGAAQHLESAGLDIQLLAVGVAPEYSKQLALRRVADHVVNTLDEGLTLFWADQERG